jgi:lysophospholipase L1-like esterase
LNGLARLLASLTDTDPARFWRIAFLIQALVVALGILAFMKGWLNRTEYVSMTHDMCRTDGLPITGKPSDDWGGLCYFRSENAQFIASGIRPKGVFIGDSHTAWWSVYDTRVFTKDIINRGLGGQTSGQVLLRFQQDVVSLHPAVAHIMIGTNDISGLIGPVSPEAYQANIRAMVELAEANGITVILGTIPPARAQQRRTGFNFLPWQPNLNRWLIAYGRERGVTVADYAAVLSASEGVIRPEFYKDDGVHLADKGYLAIYDTYRKALAEAEAKGASAH